jgi:hypothetical protein
MSSQFEVEHAFDGSGPPDAAETSERRCFAGGAVCRKELAAHAGGDARGGEECRRRARRNGCRMLGFESGLFFCINQVTTSIVPNVRSTSTMLTWLYVGSVDVN